MSCCWAVIPFSTLMNHCDSPWIITIIRHNPISFYQMITVIWELFCPIHCCLSFTVSIVLFSLSNPDRHIWVSKLSEDIYPGGLVSCHSCADVGHFSPLQMEACRRLICLSFLHLPLKLSASSLQSDPDMSQKTFLSWIYIDMTAGSIAENQCEQSAKINNIQSCPKLPSAQFWDVWTSVYCWCQFRCVGTAFSAIFLWKYAFCSWNKTIQLSYARLG